MSLQLLGLSDMIIIYMDNTTSKALWTACTLFEDSNTPNSSSLISNTSQVTASPSISNVNTQFFSSATNIFYIIVGLFGFVANAYVITVITLYKPMHKSLTNIYIANQSIIDGLVGAFLFFNTIFQNNPNAVYQPGNIVDEILCRVWYSQLPVWGLLDSSTYNIVTLTFERYFAIVHPIWHKANISNNKRILGLSIGFIWFIGLAYNAAYFLPSGGISPQGLCEFFSFYPSVTVQKSVGVITFVFEFLIPIVLIIYGYSMIAWSLHKRVQKTSNIPSTQEATGMKKIGNKDVANCGQAVASPADSAIVAAVIKEAKRNESMANARRNVLRTSAAIAFFFIFSWSFNEVGEHIPVIHYYTMHGLYYICCLGFLILNDVEIISTLRKIVGHCVVL